MFIPINHHIWLSKYVAQRAILSSVGIKASEYTYHPLSVFNPVFVSQMFSRLHLRRQLKQDIADAHQYTLDDTSFNSTSPNNGMHDRHNLSREREIHN